MVLYAAGLIGMHIPATPNLFFSLVPLNLWFTAFICIFYHPRPSLSTYFVLLFIAIAAWLVEVQGVRTGLIFGSYSYGNTLGLKLADVPITIGLNWIILLMSTNAVVEEWNAGGKIGKAALGAGLMTALDLLIEPVAVHYDFWHWSNLQVPVHNFVAWWIISFFL